MRHGLFARAVTTARAYSRPAGAVAAAWRYSPRTARPILHGNSPNAASVARASVANEHRRRNARGASPASAWRIVECPRGRQSLARHTAPSIDIHSAAHVFTCIQKLSPRRFASLQFTHFNVSVLCLSTDSSSASGCFLRTLLDSTSRTKHKRLPARDGEFEYQIKSLDDPHQRHVVRESQLRPNPWPKHTRRPTAH
jgi:hypothetical protein